MAARHLPGKHRSLGGFHGEDADLGVGGAQGAAAAGERAAGAVAGDEGIHEAVHLGENLTAGEVLVVQGVDGILKLARKKNIGVAGRHLEGEVDAGGVAVGGFEELNLAAELADEMAALDAGRLAHEDLDFVALGGTDHGEGNPGVAAGAFEDDGVGVQEPAGFGVFDDTEGEPVLDGAGGVEEFGLGVEGAVNLGEVQRNERGVADEGKDRRAGAGESGHGRRCGGAAEDRK